MTCSEFDFVCQLQTAILVFLAALVFAPLKWKLLGAAILIVEYAWFFGMPWFGLPPHFGWTP